MSVEDLKSYVKTCAEDENLREKAKEIGINNVEKQKEHAKELGYHWDENDLQALLKEQQADGELSEADLENVAGGNIVADIGGAVIGAVEGAVSGAVSGAKQGY